MQRILINDRFDLVYDDLGNKYLLEKRISKETNKAKEKVYCGYHWHFEHLLNCFAQHRLDEKDAATVKGALKAITEVEKETKELSKQIGAKLDDEFEKVRDMR